MPAGRRASGRRDASRIGAHSSSRRASARKSSGERRSARASAGWPSCVSASRTCSRERGGSALAPAASRASRRASCVDARTPPATSARSAGDAPGVRAVAAAVAQAPRMRNEHRVDVGHGMEDGARDRPHAPPPRTRAARAPRAPRRRRRPAPAASRSPTSRCTIATHVRTPGSSSMRPQQHAGGDTVGQVRDDLVGRGLQRGQVERHRVGPVHGDVGVRGRSHRRAHRAGARRSRPRARARRARARYSESTPRPPPTSSTTSRGASSAARPITPRMFESIRKFCPSSRSGRTPKRRIRRRLGCTAVRLRARLDRALGHGAHAQPNTRAALRVTAAPSCLDADAAQLGQEGGGVHDERRLVALLAHGLRGQVGRVGLHQQPLLGHALARRRRGLRRSCT